MAVAATTALGLGASIPAGAQTIVVSQSLSNGGLDLLTFAIDPAGVAGQFDTIDFTPSNGGGIESTTAGAFAQGAITGLPLTAGADDSGIFLFTGANTPGGSSVIGLTTEDTSSLIAGAVSDIAGNGISTEVFAFAQVAFQAGFDPALTYSFSLLDGGELVAALTGSFPPALPLAGDYNGDGNVTAADYTVWRDAEGVTVAPGTGADGSGNGIVDGPDYSIWVANFGAASFASGSVFAAPEPSSVVVLTLVALAASSNPPRRRRAG